MTCSCYDLMYIGRLSLVSTMHSGQYEGEWSVVPEKSGPFYVKTEAAPAADKKPRMRWNEQQLRPNKRTEGPQKKRTKEDDEDDSWNARDFIHSKEFASWPEDEDVVTERLDRERWEQLQARNALKPIAWQARHVLTFKKLGD